ncbi:MAG TPA: hypothetical protein DCR24_01785 [Bacillus bacterium]|nr:hypothetical protein [Bacillus sp. (in: firmicutes)]
MNQSMNNLISKAKVALNHAFGQAKETIFSITGTSSATVKQIADFVMNHPDTRVVKKQYIGVPLTFYELEQGQMNYYLETNSAKILQLDVHSNNHTVISYRSYRDQASLNNPVRFPDLHGTQS